MEKIIFLDASTIQYGDIVFSSLESLGSLVCYDNTRPDEIVERCKDAAVIITNKVVIDCDVMNGLPKLRMIAEAATGYNNIDINEALRRGITVANVPGYSTASVAQLTITFILALSSNILWFNKAAHDGSWSASPIFTLGTWPFSDVAGKTVGIMGYGAIGREVARLCHAFGMKLIALKRDGTGKAGDIERVSLDEIARRSDFISIHMPLTPYSRGLIDRNFFSSMKNDAYLINMSRGPIVTASDLLWALENRIIAGAAVDVMDREPPTSDDPLLRCDNLIITPHIAWASLESRTRLTEEIAANIKSFLEGKKRNNVTG